MTNLKIIKGDGTKRRKFKDGEPLQCHHCLSRTLIETKIGVRLKDGKPTGGTKVYRCYHCGKVVH